MTARTRASLLSLILLVSDGQAATFDHDAYRQLIYDYEVALICGLVTAKVNAAYSAKRTRLEAGQPNLTETRTKAMAAADLEYANRGLGGFRPWCETEGRAGVTRLLAVKP